MKAVTWHGKRDVTLHRGAGKVFGVDLVPERLAMAARHGVEPIDLGEVDDLAEHCAT